MYLARSIRQDCGQLLDEDEFLDVVRMPLEQAVEMVMENRLPDAKTQIALLKAARILGK